MEQELKEKKKLELTKTVVDKQSLVFIKNTTFSMKVLSVFVVYLKCFILFFLFVQMCRYSFSFYKNKNTKYVNSIKNISKNVYNFIYQSKNML